MEDFELIKKIGKGAFGTVYLAKHFDEKIALKIYREDVDWESFEKSLELAMKLKHPNLMICKTFFHDRIVTEENKLRGKSTVNLLAVLEYIPGDNLYDSYRQDEQNSYKQDVRMDFYLAQILNGLKYLHSQKIIHCDIKPDNIIVNNNEVKIIDYDFLTKKYKYKKIGTPLYSSPEIYAKEKYDEKIDNWSLGVTLYYCLTKNYPFIAKNKENLKKLILSEYLPDFSVLPNKYQQIVKGLLIKEPKNRMTLNEVSQLTV